MTKNLPKFIYFVIPGGVPDFVAVNLEGALEMAVHPEQRMRGKLFPVHRWKLQGRAYVFDCVMKDGKFKGDA